MIIRKEDIILNEANVYLSDNKNKFAANVWVNKGGHHSPRVKICMGHKFNNSNVSVGFELITNQIIKVETNYFKGSKSDRAKCIDTATAFIVFAADVLKDGYESPTGIDQKALDNCERNFNKLSTKEFNDLVETGKKNAKSGVKFN